MRVSLLIFSKSFVTFNNRSRSMHGDIMSRALLIIAPSSPYEIMVFTLMLVIANNAMRTATIIFLANSTLTLPLYIVMVNNY